MPTTIAPCSFAICATTGAVPVPVPPPMPAVMNTRSASQRSPSRVGRAISAARLPTSGNPPAPRPLVSDLPTSTLLSAWIMSRCCLSVLIAMVSAPLTCMWYRRLMVLLPAPPHPTMTIRGWPRMSSSPSAESVFRYLSRSACFNASLMIVCITIPPKR